MADIDELRNYFASLRKRFDKDLFQHNIDKLAYVVDTRGLDYDEFHELFKVWLNLSIPMTKWMSLGICLVPPDIVEKRTVEYTLRWILANMYETNSTRVAFLLDWLTVAMETESIDMMVLDYGYEIFNSILTFESLTVHVIKLVYTLTKPADVARWRVLELLDFAQKIEGKKTIYRQLQLLLGLYKSYKPECVPENVPAVSIHCVFQKLNSTLLSRFRRIQERRNGQCEERNNWIWFKPPINPDGFKNKKAQPLVPNIQLVNTDEQNAVSTTCLDSSAPLSVMQHHLRHDMRPARLRGLLCSMTGQVLLATMSSTHQAFFMHDVEYLLNYCFFEVSPYSYAEKQDLLQRLAQYQRTLLQGIPVVTAFLAQYLPFWNEKDFFSEILELCEWVSIECPRYVRQIAGSLQKFYLRAQPIEQCAILRAVTSMYCNLVYASTKSQKRFVPHMVPSPDMYLPVLKDLAERISEFSEKGLQVNPEDMRVLYSAIWSAKRRGCAELRYQKNIGALLPTIALALPLVNVSAVLIDNMAELVILTGMTWPLVRYQIIVEFLRYPGYTLSRSKRYNRIMASKGMWYLEQAVTLNKYLLDLVNCLYYEEAFTHRKAGLIFSKLHPKLVRKLEVLVPDLDAKLSFRNHIAFAPYIGFDSTSSQIRQSDNKALFYSTIVKVFPNLGKFMKQALLVLRSDHDVTSCDCSQ